MSNLTGSGTSILVALYLDNGALLAFSILLAAANGWAFAGV